MFAYIMLCLFYFTENWHMKTWNPTEHYVSKQCKKLRPVEAVKNLLNLDKDFNESNLREIFSLSMIS